MWNDLDDPAVEAILRGESVARELEPLANVVDAIRSTPQQPVRPSPELAARMADGNFASAAVPRAHHHSAGRHARRRLPALRLRAKVAAGAALAVSGLAAATAASALPGPAQERIESVIEAITPFEFPHRSDFGREIADDARDGGVDGSEVSEKAKDQGQQPEIPEQADRDLPGPNDNDLPEPAQDRPAAPTPDPVEPADPPDKQVVKPTAPPDDAAPNRPERPGGRPDNPPGKD